MPYGASYGRERVAMGDPFLGGILGGIVKTVGGAVVRGAGALIRGKSVRKAVFSGAQRALPAVVGGAGAAAARLPRIVRAAGGAVAAGAAFEAGSRLVGGGGGEGRRYRRTNPANVQALRRALRRVEGFRKLAAQVNTCSGGCAPRRKRKRSC